MTTNQEARHQDLRDSTSTARGMTEDWHALWDGASVADGTFNERMLAWINDQLGTSYTNLAGAMHAYAADGGYANWHSIGGLTLNPAATLVNTWSSDGDGFAALFEGTRPAIYVKDSGTPANNTNVTTASLTDFSTFFTYTSPSVKITRQEDGDWKYQAHNYARYSETAGSWIDEQGTASASGETPPAGYSSAFEVTEGTGLSLHGVRDNPFATVVGHTYILECYAKRGTGARNLYLRHHGANFQGAYFALTGDGSVAQQDANISSSTITKVGDWYKCTIEFTSVTAGNNIYLFLADGTNPNYTGDGSSSIHVTGVHFRVKVAVDTYLPTTTAIRVALPIHYNTDGTAYGLHVESAATNVFSNNSAPSSYFNAGTGVTVTNNAASSLRGDTSAHTFVTTAVSGEHRKTRTSIIASTSDDVVFWMDVKPVDTSGYYIGFREDSVSGSCAVFDPSDMSVVNTRANGANITGVTAAVTELDDGWYRLECRFENTGTQGFGFGVHFVNPTYTSGDCYSVWTPGGEYQFNVDNLTCEVGTRATSPIRTYGSTVTRAADNISKALSAIDWVDATSTTYVKFVEGPLAASGRILDLIGAGNVRYVDFYTANGTNVAVYSNHTSAGFINAPLPNTLAGTTPNKYALLFEVDNARVYGNGTGGAARTTIANDVTATTMLVAAFPAGSSVGNVYIQEIMILPERLSDANGASLTT